MCFFTRFRSFSLKPSQLCLAVALEARLCSQVGPQNVAHGLSLLLRFCWLQAQPHCPEYPGAEMSTYGGHCLV